MTAAAAAAPQPGGARFWCRIEHDFARDAALIETADRCDTSPAVVLSIAVQLRVRESEGRRLGPADLDSLAWFCRVPAELVRRVIEMLVKLGRLAGAVLRAITRRSNTDQQRARHLAAQKRFLARRRQDRRQLSLLLPINAPSTLIKTDQAGAAAPAKPLVEPEPRPPDLRSNADQTPTKAAQKEEQRKENPSFFENKKEEVSGRCALSEAGQAAAQRAKRSNLIKTLRRWVQFSGQLDHDEQIHRLLMLSRAETALDYWDRRDAEDKACFEFLTKRARATPLDPLWVRAAEQQDTRTRLLTGWAQGGRVA